jgi:hypothetical protein
MQPRVLGYSVGAVMSLAACNTVTRGVEEAVTISATPASARIWTSLGHQCPRSPCVVKINRRTEFTAYAEARGYKLAVPTREIGVHRPSCAWDSRKRDPSLRIGWPRPGCRKWGHVESQAQPRPY